MNENTDFAAKRGTTYFKKLKGRLGDLAQSVEASRTQYEEAIAGGDYQTAANMLYHARNDYRQTMLEEEADVVLMALYREAGIQSVTGHLEGSKK